MIFSTKNVKPLHEELYSYINPKEIFMRYFPFEERKMYNSPLRKDPKPSFNIVSKNGTWFFNDFGYQGGDAVKFVEMLFGLDYYGACNKIKRDFGLSDINIDAFQKNNSTIVLDKEKKDFNMTFSPRSFNDLELAYWKQFDISKEDLENEEIFVPKRLWYNDREIYLKQGELKFIYRFTKDGLEKEKKLYTPYSEDFKWIGSVSQKHMEGLTRLPKHSNVVICTKSRKDRIVLSKIYKEVCNVQNESHKAITFEDDAFLTNNYDGKFLFFDNDSTGIESNKKLNSKGYLWINIPDEYYQKYGAKDPADIIKYFGPKEGYRILERELKNKGILI